MSNFNALHKPFFWIAIRLRLRNFSKFVMTMHVLMESKFKVGLGSQ